MNDVKKSTATGVNRRSFLQRAGLLGAAAVPFAGLMATAGTARANNAAGVPASDVAILKFLAAAELLECDLWQQYCELATENKRFRKALERIDDSLPDYVCGDYEDECSHANLINAFLVAIGEQAVNLDPFRTLPSTSARGAAQIGRLTSLRNLTVDTSYYARYRSAGNPDFGDAFPQIVNIVNRPTIPLSNEVDDSAMDIIAQTAAFHFAAIEQGGSSLYNALSTKVTNLDVLAILSSIGPTEVYHFAVFQTALQGIAKMDGGRGLKFPNLRKDPARGALMPKPCQFLDVNFPVCSIIRPRSIEKAGAVAAATGLLNSGLFGVPGQPGGQSQAFIDAAVGLALGADAAVRQM